jgi:hypothetical protein
VDKIGRYLPNFSSRWRSASRRRPWPTIQRRFILVEGSSRRRPSSWSVRPSFTGDQVPARMPTGRAAMAAAKRRRSRLVLQGSGGAASSGDDGGTGCGGGGDHHQGRSDDEGHQAVSCGGGGCKTYDQVGLGYSDTTEPLDLLFI